MDFDQIREEIDQLDAELLRIFNRRAQLALDIGALKKERGLPIYDPEREKRILERVTRDNPGPLSDAAIVRLFERVIDESRSLERARAREE
ncbi:MAG: hypothetical protein Tsb0017_21560 [Geothermobacteraceae bacterium]